MSQFANQRFPVVKFPKVGDKVGGKVLYAPEDYQVRKFGSKTNEFEFWPDGSPKLGTRVTIATADGPQTIWAQSGLLAAIRKAVGESAGDDVEVGGFLTVERTEDGKPKAGGQPPRNYEASYEPPSESAASDDGPPF